MIFRKDRCSQGLLLLVTAANPLQLVGVAGIFFQEPTNYITGKSLSEALLFAEHGVYKNCSECQKQFLYTTTSPQVRAWNFHILNL